MSKLVSKWLPANGIFWNDAHSHNVEHYTDPELLKIQEQALLDNLYSKTKKEFNPIDLDEVFSVNPADEKIFKGCTTVRFKNGYSCVVDIDVHTVYEKLLAREEYVDRHLIAIRKLAEQI